MVFMPYLLTLCISLPSWTAFKWLFWNLCGLAPLLHSCLFFMLAPKTNSARFVRQDLPFMEPGRYFFVSSCFSRCWVISPLWTSLKSCLWLEIKYHSAGLGADFQLMGVGVCVCMHHFLRALISTDSLQQICLGFCLFLLTDARRCLLYISFSLPLFVSKKRLKTSVIGHLISPAVPSSSVS